MNIYHIVGFKCCQSILRKVINKKKITIGTNFHTLISLSIIKQFGTHLTTQTIAFTIAPSASLINAIHANSIHTIFFEVLRTALIAGCLIQVVILIALEANIGRASASLAFAVAFRTLSDCLCFIIIIAIGTG